MRGNCNADFKSALPRIALREKNAVGLRIQGNQQFAGEPGFNSARFFWMDEIANDGLQPGIVAHAEYHRGPLLHIEPIDGRSRQQIAKYLYLFLLCRWRH